MSEMQKFYESEMVGDPTNPYQLLAQVQPETLVIDNLLEWFSW